MKAKLRAFNNFHKEIFLASVVVCVLCFVLYGYFLAQSMMDVASRERVVDSTVALRSKVAQLEFEYMSLHNAVTEEEAVLQGYVVEAPVAYVAKDVRLSMADSR